MGKYLWNCFIVFNIKFIYKNSLLLLNVKLSILESIGEGGGAFFYYFIFSIFNEFRFHFRTEISVALFLARAVTLPAAAGERTDVTILISDYN